MRNCETCPCKELCTELNTNCEQPLEDLRSVFMEQSMQYLMEPKREEYIALPHPEHNRV